jgi:hypothetical protein
MGRIGGFNLFLFYFKKKFIEKLRSLKKNKNSKTIVRS